jgi:NAD(P)H-hydrate epimerase
MVHCAIPASISDILAVKLTEPVLHAMPVSAEQTLDRSATEAILALAASMQAICIGPGISHEKTTSALVRDLVARSTLPMVLDADGLNAFKGAVEALEKHAGPIVLTPHHGEWERLFGPLAALPPERIDQVRKAARRLNATILLKGSPTIVASPDGKAHLLPFGNSALAKAGSGDVLSGIITSLLAQGAKPDDAAILGVYLHGTAGTIAAATLTEYAVTAIDVVGCIGAGLGTLL